MLLKAIQTTLQAHADATRAPGMHAYMREQFPFLGIATPIRRAVCKDLLRTKQSAPELLALAQQLWQCEEREYQYVALDLLARHWKSLQLRDLEALLALAQQKSWWDTVDGLAGIVGDVVRAARQQDDTAQECMDAALRHPNLWVRRIAMLHQLGWRAQTDTTRLFSYALQLAAEEDFFIRKAIGWALRDYAHFAPEAVSDFLAQDGQVLSSLTRREAAKHLGKD